MHIGILATTVVFREATSFKGADHTGLLYSSMLLLHGRCISMVCRSRLCPPLELASLVASDCVIYAPAAYACAIIE